ncbi:Tripartite tricarboxylate transporter family receptor [Pigmentiphaga humi]|uniref:Tripartite tricarboxylate transporter family receptor n=1 Tax=Pigmentiphaga humi TaxID=2478468 RepID=A0A3P4AX71_9BURK|nr:tripartite tricarboxylate transporter substrate binding protein [Pigmentiphaga humi]VCU68643.1 Tripartite tricarboxylate transporter family receptor [Pigmentiphaga humi]
MKTPLLPTVLAATLLTLAAPLAAQAQAYPNKPVKIVSTFPVGAGPDVALRLVADKLSQKWGQPVVVENKPGGNGFIAVDAVKRSAADGYTLVQMDNAQTSAQPYLFKKLPYDLMRDFEPITPMLRNYFFLVVPVDSPYKSTGDLLKAARAQPGKITYGSWFIGSPGHIGGAMLEQEAGVEMMHVPYKEMGQLYTAVANKELAWAFGSGGSAGPLQRAGKVRYLAVSSPKRLEGFPEVPTISESGGPAGYDLMGSVALLAPKGTPAEIADKIQADVAAVVRDPEIAKRYDGMFYEPYTMTRPEFVKTLADENRKFGQVLQKLNIALD